MKVIVCTLVFLFLIGGLTLMHVDSNTELPFQSLSAVEMLTTQGAGQCEKVDTFLNGGPKAAECSTKDCWFEWNGKGWSSFKRMALGYDWCNKTFDANKDCITYTHHRDVDEENPPLLIGTQDCAFLQEYWGAYCIGWFARPFVGVETVEFVKDVQRAVPCAVVVGTTT